MKSPMQNVRIAVPKKEVKKEARLVRVFLLIFFAVAICAIIVVVGVHKVIEERESREMREDFFWTFENYPIMEEMYDNGQYKELVAYYEKCSDEGKSVYYFKHREFCEIYSRILDVEIIYHWKRHAVRIVVNLIYMHSSILKTWSSIKKTMKVQRRAYILRPESFRRCR